MLGELGLLCEAQHASPCPWLARGSTRYSFQSDLGAYPIAFVTPEYLREPGNIAFLLVFKALVAVSEAGFKLAFTATEVMLRVVIKC